MLLIQVLSGDGRWKKNVWIKINALKEKSKQNRTWCCDLPFPLQLDIVYHSLLSSPPLTSMQHTLPSFLLFFHVHVKDRLVFFGLTLGDCFFLFSPHTLSELSTAPFSVSATTSPSLCPSLGLLTAALTIPLGCHKSGVQSQLSVLQTRSSLATPPFTEVPETGTWCHPELPAHLPKAEKELQSSVLPPLDFISFSPFPLSLPLLGHYHLFPGLL